LFTVDDEFFYETEVKKSKFLTFIMPYHLSEQRLKELRNEHPKARHHVLCFRYMNEYAQIVEYGSDDGEPKGCAGKPSLNVLRGSELVNCATITVRYFGGIKLGTGGMVRAYSKAIQNVVAHAKLKDFVIKTHLIISLNYSHGNQVSYFLEQEDIHIQEKVFKDQTIEMTLEATEEQKALLKQYSLETLLITLK